MQTKLTLTLAAVIAGASSLIAQGGQPWGTCNFQPHTGSSAIYVQWQPCNGVAFTCQAEQCADGYWTYLCNGYQDICGDC